MRLMAFSAFVGLLGVGCGHVGWVPVERAGHGETGEAWIHAYVISEAPLGTGGSGAGRDCQQEHVECFDKCWNDPKPPYPHKRYTGWYYEYCTTKCRKEFNDCMEELEREKAQAEAASSLEFGGIDTALGWLKSHKTHLVVGTIVVVGAATFVIATGGTGALLLVPVAL